MDKTVNSLAKAWANTPSAYFKTREGKIVSFVERHEAKSGTTYVMSDHIHRYPDGRTRKDGNTSPKDIVGYSTKKSRATYVILDERLLHLRKKAKEANNDLRSYIKNKYPVDDQVAVHIKGEPRYLRVLSHGHDRMVAYDHVLKKTRSISYDHIDSRIRG